MGSLFNPKITITGDIGSGKSIIAKLLAEVLGYKLFSTGTIQREIAEGRGMSTLELNRFSETHPEIDEQIDSFSKALGHSHESAIVDSRMAWFFLPDSFKVYLQVDVNVAARRINSDVTRKSEGYKSVEETKSKIISRQQSEIDRFHNLYGTNLANLSNYDLVVDTSYSSPEGIVSTIIDSYTRWSQSAEVNRVWLSPKLLYPTQLITELAGDSAKQVVISVREHGFHMDLPVVVLRSGNFYFIYDGHKRSSAALLNNIDLIPVYVLAKDDEEIIPKLSVRQYVRTNSKVSWIYDWEDCHGFVFTDYPKDILGNYEDQT